MVNEIDLYTLLYFRENLAVNPGRCSGICARVLELKNLRVVADRLNEADVSLAYATGTGRTAKGYPCCEPPWKAAGYDNGQRKQAER